MEKFKLIITETLEKEVEIEADNINEAFDIVEDKYFNGEIVLDYNDHCSTKLQDIDYTKVREL